jgi:hypothetical protein
MADQQKSWMDIEVPLSKELQLEQTLREVSQHPDTDKVRALTASLIRQNFYQQQLLNNAILHISELETLVFLGASADADELPFFMKLAQEICDELGVG